MGTEPIPNLVEQGWELGDELVGPDHPDYALLFYANGDVRFEHRCDRGDRGVVDCAPALQLNGGGHRIISAVPATVQPSILCPDCGTHGFVTDGKWRAC